MKFIINLTHILFSVFLGMIVGSLISKSKTLLTISIILAVIDMIVGILLQYIYEKYNRF